MTPRRTAVAGLIAVAALTGCSGPRSGTSVSSAVSGCAAVLPVARAAVSAPAKLVSVHALRRGDAAHYLREVGVEPSPAPSSGPSSGSSSGSSSDPDTDQPQDLVPGQRTASPTPSASPGSGPRSCVVVYRGPFPQGLPAAPPGTSGEYALVLADVRHAQVRRVVLTSQLPPELRHS